MARIIAHRIFLIFEKDYFFSITEIFSACSCQKLVAFFAKVAIWWESFYPWSDSHCKLHCSMGLVGFFIRASFYQPKISGKTYISRIWTFVKNFSALREIFGDV